MPIKPDRMKLYPGGSIRSKEWLAIRDRILVRAGDRCECEGDCGLKHRDEMAAYWGMDSDPYTHRCAAMNHCSHPITESVVVLTIAHLDHNPEHNDDSNLKAMCQRCHNKLDQPHRQINAAKTRRRKMGIEDMFGDGV